MSTLQTLKSGLQQKPSSRERLMFLGVILAGVVVFFKMYVVESRKGIEELQTQVDQALAERKALEADIVLAQKVAQGGNARDDAARIQWVGKKDTVNRAADELVKAAQDNNVYLVKFSLPDYKEKQNYLMRPVQITLAGALFDLGRFIESSERLQVPLVIEHLALEQNPDFSDYITLRLEGGFYAEK